MGKTVIKARDVMHKEHLELDGMATVKDALDAMKETHSSVVIVRKRHENDAFGMVLLSDIVKKVLAKDRPSERINIYEIMSKPVVHVDPEMDIRYCARLFDKFGLSRAPVLENGTIVGLVSYTDIVLKGLFRDLRAS